MKNQKILIYSFTIIFTFLILFLGNTYAVEYFSIGGKPANPNPDIPNSAAWFIYNLDLGESIEDELIVLNTFDRDLDLLIYAADGLKSSSGGFAVKQFVEEKEEVGSWVKFYPDPIPEAFQELFEQENESILGICSLQLEESDDWNVLEEWCKGVESVQMSLEAKGERSLRFVFSVPTTASVGEYTGGIMIQKVEAESTDALQGITLTTRVGIRIYQTVPGDIVRNIRVTKFNLEKLYKELEFERLYNRELPPEEILITTEIENLGNVSIYFTEEITITQEFPRKHTETVEDRTFQVLRDDTFISNYSWYNPRLGKFTIQNNIFFTDENDEEILLKSETITIWIIPWRETILGGGLLLITLFILFTIKLVKKKNYSGKAWSEYIVQVGETLQDLAERFDVKWKVLAKTNKIKAPYVLKPGEMILVPKKKND